MVEFIKREPVVVLGLIEAAIVVAVAFGVPISTEQKVAIIGLGATVMTIVTRQLVTPTAKIASK
jgi:hypothetical protein